MKITVELAKEKINKVLGVIIPIMTYGACVYLTQKFPCHSEISFGDVNPDTDIAWGCGWCGQATNAIANSNMWSSDKKTALQALRTDESYSYYEAIIAIAKSGMRSSDKRDAICGL